MPTPEELDKMTRDQRDRNDRALSAVARAVTETGGKDRFLHVVSERWPRLRGAQVADVLEITTDRDMFLDITEPFFEAHEGELPPGPAVSYALHALIILDGIDGAAPGLDRLLLLLNKAGCGARVSGHDDAQAGRDDNSEEWPERLRPRYRAGFRAGRLDLVRQAEHAAKVAYDPVPDLAKVLDELRDWAGGGGRQATMERIMTGPYATLRARLPLDRAVSTETAIRDALNAAQAARIVTRTGRVVTEADIAGWAEEAEAGYDVSGQAPPPHPELGPGTGHQLDGPADCPRCQLLRDNPGLEAAAARAERELALSDDDSEAAADAAQRRSSLATDMERVLADMDGNVPADDPPGWRPPDQRP